MTTPSPKNRALAEKIAERLFTDEDNYLHDIMEIRGINTSLTSFSLFELKDFIAHILQEEEDK